MHDKSRKYSLWWIVVPLAAVGLVLLLASCANTNTPSTNTTPTTISPTALTCTQCHNSTTTIVAKMMQWQESGHSNFELANEEGGNQSCVGCHSSEGFVKRIASNIAPDKLTQGETNPSPQSCYTCHEIHTTYTSADYSIRANASVTLYVSGKTFNAGKGNLCATCHQPRRAAPATGAGSVNVTSTHWGPHPSAQAGMILGIVGYGKEMASIHTMVADSCVTCHMNNGNHLMAADVATCQTCHGGAKNFDIGGTQTEVKAKLDELKALLEAKGLLKNDNPVVGVYSEAQAGALWNYMAITEDGSNGVHNPAYTEAILQQSIDALK